MMLRAGNGTMSAGQVKRSRLEFPVFQNLHIYTHRPRRSVGNSVNSVPQPRFQAVDRIGSLDYMNIDSHSS